MSWSRILAILGHCASTFQLLEKTVILHNPQEWVHSECTCKSVSHSFFAKTIPLAALQAQLPPTPQRWPPTKTRWVSWSINLQAFIIYIYTVIYCIYCNNLFIYLMQTYCSFINFMQHQSPLTLDLRRERRNGNASDRSKRSRPRRIWHWRSCWPKLAYPGLV